MRALLIIVLFGILYDVDAQIVISETTTTPDPSAMLDVTSTQRGLLPPRMTAAERDEISNPAAGLIIYCSDCLEMQMYNDTAWTNMIGMPAKGKLPACSMDSIEVDGQMYAVVSIGDQCWMAENLNIGTMILGSSDQMNNGIIEKFCYDDLETNCDIYGGLYQWNEAMQYSNQESSSGICPSGWHIPSDDEIKTLEITLGLSQSEADAYGDRGSNQGSMLASNATLWINGSLESDPEFGLSGFNALPGGNFYNPEDTYYNINKRIFWWSSSLTFGEGLYRYITNSQTEVGRGIELLDNGFSIRCVKD